MNTKRKIVGLQIDSNKTERFAEMEAMESKTLYMKASGSHRKEDEVRLAIHSLEFY